MLKTLKAAMARLGLKRQKMTKEQMIEEFIETLRPQPAEKPLIRIGGNGDGAYLLPNKCSPSVFYKNIEVPPVLEIAFYRKERFKAANNPLRFSHELNEINVPGTPDVVLPAIWYS